MNTTGIARHILPIYLIIVLLIQIDLTIPVIVLSCLPLILVSIALQLRKKNLGILGLFLFYIVSLAQLQFYTIENYFTIFLELLFLVMPSILLLNQILQLDNQKTLNQFGRKKPLIIAIALLIIILIIFNVLTIIPWEGFLLTSASTEGQIILLGGITLLCCAPFFLSRH